MRETVCPLTAFRCIVFALSFGVAPIVRSDETGEDEVAVLYLGPVSIMSSGECDECELCGESDCDGCEEEGPEIEFGTWAGYNTTQSSTTWLEGSDFGMFSLESFPTLELGENASIKFGTGIHFLDGPTSPDMPSRLFDFQMAVQTRTVLMTSSMLDLKLGVGAFSDFNGSARKGVRFPGHAVVYRQWTPGFVSVYGAEFLDRDDVSVLPVVGFVAQPHDDLIFECIFPRPKLQVRFSRQQSFYVSGELGGGTWAIKRENRLNDNATYRDLRITAGIQDFEDPDGSTFEIGWAFDRSIEYRSAIGDASLDGAFIFRWLSHF